MSEIDKYIEKLDEEIEQGRKELAEKETGPSLKNLKEIHAKICDVLRRYCDLDEKYYSLLSLWVIGTYFHKDFLTYPYLYFNAIKGSGKTRLLKLVAALSKNGKVIGNISEAVLFRTAKDSTFCIDELEQIGRKEKQTLRELLDAAYKKGLMVERAYKMKEKSKESYKIERFDVFCPVAMANIRGMEEVLSDRCITIVIEKSNNWRITRLLEIFDYDPEIKEVLSYLQDLVTFQNVTNAIISLYTQWNEYVYEYCNNKGIMDTLGEKRHGKTSLTNAIFKKIAETSLNSRELELFFPLFVIADYCGVLDETIKIAKGIAQERQETDIMESKDVALLDFVSQQLEIEDFIPLKEILKNFKMFLEEDEEDSKWTNLKWMGRALKRLGLVKKKKKLSEGRVFVLDYAKAKQKIRMFKEFKEIEPQQELQTALPSQNALEIAEEWQGQQKIVVSEGNIAESEKDEDMESEEDDLE